MTRVIESSHVIADLCIVPIGTEVNTSKYIVEVQKILQEAGLHPNLHACGTNVGLLIEIRFNYIFFIRPILVDQPYASSRG
ncbi:15505_t:CDS:2, partial [Acaulospora colombiana]